MTFTPEKDLANHVRFIAERGRFERCVCMPPHLTHSPINVICCADRISRSFAPVHSALGPGHPPPHDACCPLHSPRLNADNLTKPSERSWIACLIADNAA
jgi:hypothetical protein